MWIARGYKGFGGGTREVVSGSPRARTSRANTLLAMISAPFMYKKADGKSLSLSFRLRTMCKTRPCLSRKNFCGGLKNSCHCHRKKVKLMMKDKRENFMVTHISEKAVCIGLQSDETRPIDGEIVLKNLEIGWATVRISSLVSVLT